jgi:hypothetical protein
MLSKAIFGLFIAQLKELFDITNDYYRDRFYLLESLSMVQSILIIKQLSNSASMMTELFRVVFSLAEYVHLTAKSITNLNVD